MHQPRRRPSCRTSDQTGGRSRRSGGPILGTICLTDTVWSQWFCQLRLKYDALPPSGGSYDPFTLARIALLSILRFESYAQRSMLLIRIGRRGGLQARATDPIHLP